MGSGITMCGSRLIDVEHEKARKRPDSHNQLYVLYLNRIPPNVPIRYFSISKRRLKEFGRVLGDVSLDDWKIEIESLCDTFVNEGAFEKFRINARYLTSYAMELREACSVLTPLLRHRSSSFDGYLTVLDVLTANS